MESETAINSLLNSLQSTEIELNTDSEICPSSFQLGDKFSSIEEVQNAIKDFESKTGIKYYIQDSRKVKSSTDHPDFSINQALRYSRLKYNCVQGGKYTLKKDVVFERHTRTLKNGCPAHVCFGITRDKQFLEVRSIGDMHNHKISEARAKRKVSDLFAERGLELRMKKKNKNSAFDEHRLTQVTECQEASAENNFNEPVSEDTGGEIGSIQSRADKAVADLVKEKKRSNDLKEQLLEESIKRNNCLDALLRTNVLDEELLEESRTRNKYLEAFIKINCLRHNQSFDALMNMDLQEQD
ncbi:hypothetical protein JTE90_013724 [Oedothorax gibbosus]|uniref:ZSWIM3 N-terminal domain-containing protein n=1 Tax=Oedothorax gibbosus TaxID=931172 RepID=A0AAV6UXV4_9ARAC|nr:hypothetical protein JTE90_013724 [Oedothorax gibbosus]